MKTKILSILALLLMTVTQGAWADELTVYDGTQASPLSPAYMNHFDMYTRSQYIIPAANLEAMNGKIITALKYYSTTSNKTTCNVDVYLKEVSYTTFNSTPTFETKSGIVYTGKLSIASDGTLTITFTTPYTYNGGHLLIGMENTETGNSILSSFYGQIVTGTVAYGSSTVNREDFIPKTTFTYETPVPPTAVDLGLPSGKKWADRNVGALSATGYGTYYAWSSSDIATAQWGNDWRMPTLTEAQELINNTDHEWATIGGVNGTKFMKKTDHSVYIFIPAAGWNANTNVGTKGTYWTSTTLEADDSKAYELFLDASNTTTGNDRKTYQFTVRPVQMFAGEGTEASPYLIASTTDWNNLVSAVNGGETYSGKYFKMTANVGTVTTWMTGTFSGTFDGYSKTLTVGYSAYAMYCAPFGKVSGATIKNLKVAGSITSTSQYAAGIIASVSSGTATIENCLVSATITCNFNYNGNTSALPAGFVAMCSSGATVNMTGCAFTGSFAGSSSGIGGFLAYQVGSASFTNCLFKPTSVTGLGGAFSRQTATVNNCYYTQSAGTTQGIQARSISAGDYVSSLSVTKGDGTEYDVSGITVYSGGIDFNDGSTTTFYGGSDQTVSLALTAETRTGYHFKQYAASQGTLSGQTTDTPTLTMPAANSTANDVVTISAEYDPLYTATFADGIDNNGWTISPSSATAGQTVTISYTGSRTITSVSAVKKPFGLSTFSFATPARGESSNLTFTGASTEKPVWFTGTVDTHNTTGTVVYNHSAGGSYDYLSFNGIQFYAGGWDVPGALYITGGLGTEADPFVLSTTSSPAPNMELTVTPNGEKSWTITMPTSDVEIQVLMPYTVTFADGNDNDDWMIDPEQQAVGGTVTVSYTGENKVKSVTVAPKGALTGKFSVSSTKQVQFSKGNLQYDGSAWSFHTNQYDCVFTSISTATDYPMDIFCWGNIANPAYDGSTGIGTNGVDLSGSSDWGSNTITNGCTGWRTLTLAEWEYLFANHSYGYATVAGQTGVIILPDVFTDPMRNNGSAAFVASTASWTANVYAAGDDWTAMEKAGALFLPAAGGRNGSYIGSVGIRGSYWSSTAYTTHGRFINFEAGSAPETTNYSIHGYGKSVRLVKVVE